MGRAYPRGSSRAAGRASRTGTFWKVPHDSLVYPLGRATASRDPSAMPAPSAPLSHTALRTLLATERDPHRRQRELVRASLLSCPVKPGSSRLH